MKEQPPSKKVMPVSGTTMLNFIHWVAAYYPSIQDLQSLSESHLLQLTQEFEQSRPDIEKRSSEAWLDSMTRLFSGDSRYREAKDVMKKMK